MFTMLVLLLEQFNVCARVVDVIETRHKLLTLVFLGLLEAIKEDYDKTMLSSHSI